MPERHHRDGVARPKACQGCQFYHTLSKSGSGECRRNAPRPREVYRCDCDEAETSPAAWWPNVTPTDWCGEHRPKGA